MSADNNITMAPKWSTLLLGLLVGLSYSGSSFATKILVFSKVQNGAYRHSSIPNGITAIHEIGASKHWQVDDTVDARAFNGKNLAQYDVIVWNNTGGVVLNEEQRLAFQQFIHNGGGYVGIHMAAAGTFVDGGSTCSEPDWPWFARLVGATFKSHPEGTPAGALTKNPAEQLGLTGLPNPWIHHDEWYEWEESPADNPNIKVLLWVDESSYTDHSGKHPVSWYQEFEGGRVFYTALGHTEESFNEDNFRKHIAAGIEWAAAHSPNVATIGKIETSGLIVDLDADKGLTLENGDKVSAWRNQISDFAAQSFVKRDEGRRVPGSGRPTLKRSVGSLNGHNSLSFRESELVNLDENDFDDLVTGSGYTWLVVMAPYAQIAKDPIDNVSKYNAFIGDLRNGPQFEGFTAGLDYDNTVWVATRNGVTFGRIDQNNPFVAGPRLERNQYYVLAGRMGGGLGAVPVEVFVDSPIPAASQMCPVNPSAKSSKLAIGQERDAIEHPGRESFDGEVARVLIYQRPLNDEELSRTINALKLIYF